MRLLSVYKESAFIYVLFSDRHENNSSECFLINVFVLFYSGLNMNVQWTNLNPQWLVNTVKNVPAFSNFAAAYPIQTIEAFMKRVSLRFTFHILLL